MRAKDTIPLWQIVVVTIRERSDPSQWKYVDTKSNPADEASRGLPINAFISKCRWIKGPEFLWSYEGNWFERPQVKTEVLENVPEIKRETKCTATLTTRQDTFEETFLKCSSWYCLKRVIAWVLRYLSKVNNVIAKKRQSLLVEFSPNDSQKDLITVEEMEKAEVTILSKVPSQAYREEILKLACEKINIK